MLDAIDSFSSIGEPSKISIFLDRKSKRYEMGEKRYTNTLPEPYGDKSIPENLHIATAQCGIRM